MSNDFNTLLANIKPEDLSSPFGTTFFRPQFKRANWFESNITPIATPNNSRTKQDKFRQKVLASIRRMLENDEGSCQIYLSWMSEEMGQISANPMLSYLLFSPDNPNSLQGDIDRIYRDAEDMAWRDFRKLIGFGGTDGGSDCIVLDPSPTDKEDLELMKKWKENFAKALENVKKTSQKTKIEWPRSMKMGERAWLMQETVKDLPKGYDMTYRGEIFQWKAKNE